MSNILSLHIMETEPVNKTSLNIKGHVKTYDWGRSAKTSLISSLFPSQDIIQSLPYAELWFGTHCNGPSTIYETGETLSSVIGHDLPFLFKILSIEKPLSIQVHPDKLKAEQLHITHPLIYKDSNHKPEMVLALGDFYALCGFRPIKSILSMVRNYPEFAEIFSTGTLMDLERNPCKETLHAAFSEYMRNERPELVERLSKACSKMKPVKYSFLYWIKRILELFPGDWGVFCIFFMNMVCLEPGQTLYIAPNQIHAYLYGECVECMASSDNVVRAGLTGKFKDVVTLLDIVDCTPTDPVIGSGSVIDSDTIEYTCESKEFALESIITEKVYPLRTHNSESILVIVQGKGQIKDDTRIINVGRGVAFYIFPNEAFWMYSDTGLMAFRCFIPNIELCNLYSV